MNFLSAFLRVNVWVMVSVTKRNAEQCTMIKAYTSNPNLLREIFCHEVYCNSATYQKVRGRRQKLDPSRN